MEHITSHINLVPVPSVPWIVFMNLGSCFFFETSCQLQQHLVAMALCLTSANLRWCSRQLVIGFLGSAEEISKPWCSPTGEDHIIQSKDRCFTLKWMASLSALKLFLQVARNLTCLLVSSQAGNISPEIQWWQIWKNPTEALPAMWRVPFLSSIGLLWVTCGNHCENTSDSEVSL